MNPVKEIVTGNSDDEKASEEEQADPVGQALAAAAATYCGVVRKELEKVDISGLGKDTQLRLPTPAMVRGYARDADVDVLTGVLKDMAEKNPECKEAFEEQAASLALDQVAQLIAKDAAKPQIVVGYDNDGRAYIRESKAPGLVYAQPAEEFTETAGVEAEEAGDVEEEKDAEVAAAGCCCVM